MGRSRRSQERRMQGVAARANRRGFIAGLNAPRRKPRKQKAWGSRYRPKKPRARSSTSLTANIGNWKPRRR